MTLALARNLGGSSEKRTPQAARGSHDALSRATDAELGRALIDNEPAAFYVAWQRFLPVVRSMVRRSLGHTAEDEDIVQEVFFVLFRRVQTLRDPLAVRAFVMAITVRTLSYEQRRRRKRAYSPLETEEQTDGLRVTAEPAAKHAFVSFQHLVGRLRERDRTAFVLRFIEGMDSKEIGAALGVSAPTARRSFSRALERLKLWAGRDPFLADFLGEEGPLP